MMLPTGHSKQYAWLRQLPFEDKGVALPRLSPKQLRLLETTKSVTPAEKLGLLCILLHLKFTCELSLDNRSAKLVLVNQLNLPCFINAYRHPKKGLIQWLQVSSNHKIARFIKKHSRDMSCFEAGLLYGYPPTAIFAFMGLLSQQTKVRIEHPADWFLGMVYSQAHFSDERQYWRDHFDHIASLSPLLHKELMGSFASRTAVPLGAK